MPENSTAVYTQHNGRTFKFNDHVCVEMIAARDERRTGRLVQVRLACGQFSSDMFLIRLRDGSLMTFENVLLRHVNDKEFEHNFYVANGAEPPNIPVQPTYPGDTPTTMYSIKNEYAESGFVVADPKQPQRPGAFSLAICSTPDAAHV